MSMKLMKQRWLSEKANEQESNKMVKSEFGLVVEAEQSSVSSDATSRNAIDEEIFQLTEDITKSVGSVERSTQEFLNKSAEQSGEWDYNAISAMKMNGSNARMTKPNGAIVIEAVEHNTDNTHNTDSTWAFDSAKSSISSADEITDQLKPKLVIKWKRTKAQKQTEQHHSPSNLGDNEQATVSSQSSVGIDSNRVISQKSASPEPSTTLTFPDSSELFAANTLTGPEAVIKPTDISEIDRDDDQSLTGASDLKVERDISMISEQQSLQARNKFNRIESSNSNHQNAEFKIPEIGLITEPQIYSKPTIKLNELSETFSKTEVSTDFKNDSTDSSMTEQTKNEQVTPVRTLKFGETFISLQQEQNSLQSSESNSGQAKIIYDRMKIVNDPMDIVGDDPMDIVDDDLMDIVDDDPMDIVNDDCTDMKLDIAERSSLSSNFNVIKLDQLITSEDCSGIDLQDGTKQQLSDQALCTDVKMNEAVVVNPNPYLEIDENIILCDENLIKEAKVVRCFCEPTEEDIAAGRGCGSGCINRELYTECGSRCPSGAGCSNRRFRNKQYANVEIFYAGVKGWGLRAAEPLEPGRFIMEYVGEVIDAEEMSKRGRRYGRDPKHVHHYLMALKNGAVIDATARGNVSRFINHSCDPNCESQKWTVDRQLRIGFFAIKPIAVNEEIVFDYQLLRYGRKAQRCFCGAANCRGRIGDDSDSESEDKQEELLEFEESDEDEKHPVEESRVKMSKKAKPVRKSKKKQISMKRYNQAINNALSRGPPRNRTQVRDLIRLMVQVEQASQRSSLIQCIRFAHPDVLRIFIQECGLRLLYVMLATDYPVDDQQSVLYLQMKSLDLLSVMPIATRNQLNDSHLSSTVEKIAEKKGPIDIIVEYVVEELISTVCCDIPSTSGSIIQYPENIDRATELMHCEVVDKAVRLIEKWKQLKDEYRIPRREKSDTPLSDDIRQDFANRTVLRLEGDDRNRRRSVIVERKNGSTTWRLTGYSPPPKRRYENRFITPEKMSSPIILYDLKQTKGDEQKSQQSSPITYGETKVKKRRSRFDVIGEHNPSSMYEVYVEDGEDPYAPPPPTLLPEAMFAAGLPGSYVASSGNYPLPSFPEYLDWNAVYANYDPSSAAYQQFIDYYQQQQYAVLPPPPPPRATAVADSSSTALSILEAPSPPAEPQKSSVINVNSKMLMIGPIDPDNPTDEQIQLLENHLVTLKAKRAEILKMQAEKHENQSIPPPPPAKAESKNSLWVQAKTEEGAIYYYNKETRESTWTIPEENETGGASADTTTDRNDSRATFKAAIVKHVAGILEPIRKTKFVSADDYKYVLRKLTHTILEKELKRIGEAELKVTDSVKEKAKKYVTEYITRLGDGCYSRKNKIHNTY